MSRQSLGAFLAVSVILAGCVSVKPPPEGGTAALPARLHDSNATANISMSLAPAEALINQHDHATLASGTEELKVPVAQLVTGPVQAISWLPTQIDKGVQSVCKHIPFVKVACKLVHVFVAGPPQKVVQIVKKTVTVKVPTTLKAGYNVYFDSAKLSAAGPTITAVVTATYDVKATVGEGILTVGLVSCGQSDPKPDIIVTDTISPQWGRDGKIDLHGGIPLATYGRPCDLSALDINLADVLRKVGLEHKLDDLITAQGGKVPQSLSLNPTLDKTWVELQQPIKLADNMWLIINPTGIDISAPTGAGDKLLFQGSLGAEPSLVYSAQAPVITAVARPVLGHAPNGSAFTLEAEGRANFYDVNALIGSPTVINTIDSAVTKKHIPFFGKFSIKELWLYPSQKSVVVAVTLERPVSGTIYFAGEPKYDADMDRFKVDNLDFTVETKNSLVLWGSWLLHSPIRQTIADEVNKDLAQVQDKEHPKLAALEASLRSKSGSVGGVSYTIHLDQVQPEGVYLTDYSVVARVLLSGDASVAITGIPGAP